MSEAPTENERACGGCEHKIPWDWVFCAWCGFENDAPDPHAQARLRIAAPDLLTIVNELALYSGGMEYDDWHNLVERAEAASAKAEGR